MPFAVFTAQAVPLPGPLRSVPASATVEPDGQGFSAAPALPPPGFQYSRRRHCRHPHRSGYACWSVPPVYSRLQEISALAVRL
jgi:hypothetical protein